MINKLIKNFNARSFGHLIIIFIIFAISGSLTLILSEPIINLINVNYHVKNSFILLFLRILIIFPLYQIILIFIALIFGEFSYFYDFEKNMFKKLIKKIK